jgi:hypothetical protein
MLHAQLLWAWVAAQRPTATERDNDRGEMLVWVIMTALLAAAAIAVVAIIVTKATDTANNTKTQ